MSEMPSSAERKYQQICARQLAVQQYGLENFMQWFESCGYKQTDPKLYEYYERVVVLAKKGQAAEASMQLNEAPSVSQLELKQSERKAKALDWLEKNAIHYMDAWVIQLKPKGHQSLLECVLTSNPSELEQKEKANQEDWPYHKTIATVLPSGAIVQAECQHQYVEGSNICTICGD